jgi:antitoxin component YwqK of YwqJK toxin-antitoxin module
MAVVLLAGVSDRVAIAGDQLGMPRLGLLQEPRAIATDDFASPESFTADSVRSTGRTEIFRERYPNRHVKVEREVTLDANGNYVNHGQWKMWSPNGTVLAEGQYEMGKMVGNWTRWHSRRDAVVLGQFPFNQFKPPFVSHATFVEGVLDGDWVIFDADQKKCKHVPFRKGKRHGMAIAWLPNGKILRQANFDNGLPVGDVVQVDVSSGKPKKVATYVEGREVYSKVSHYPTGRQKKTEAVFLAPVTRQTEADDYWNCRFAKFEAKGESLRHGLSKAWHANGQLRQEGQYDRGKQIGTFTFWHANGQKAAEGNYRDGRVDGRWVWWHANGQKATVGSFQHGKLVGDWRWWAEDGQLSHRIEHDGTKTFSMEKTKDAVAHQPSRRIPSR